MAKKKDNDEKESKALDILKHLDKIVKSAEELMDRDPEIIPVSPAMDIGLNGGIPKGSWVNISGRQKTGKTTLALKIAAQCQKAGMEVYYDNVEHRLKSMNLRGTNGLDISKVRMIESREGQILTAEDHLNIVTHILKTKPNVCIILDSISALCPQAESSEGITINSRHNGPKLLAQFCRQNESTVPVQGSIVIMIQHLMANVSGYGGPREDGGDKVQYQSDVKLRCKKIEPIEEGDKRVGQLVHWTVEWSALGQPGNEIVSSIRYGKGIDDISEVMELAVELGLIEKGGAWFTFEDKKLQGKANLYEYLEQNEDKVKYLYDEIRKMLC